MKNKIEKLQKEVKDYLFKNLNNFEFVEMSEFYITYKFDDKIIQVWIANGENSVYFYEGFCGLEIRSYLFSDKEKKLLWDKVESEKEQSGEIRSIKKTQMSNDLFFSFEGIYGTVKFTGYDDNDWWTKYKPETIKEDENIEWKINWENRTAKYKPNKLKNDKRF